MESVLEVSGSHRIQIGWQNSTSLFYLSFLFIEKDPMSTVIFKACDKQCRFEKQSNGMDGCMCFVKVLEPAWIKAFLTGNVCKGRDKSLLNLNVFTQDMLSLSPTCLLI